MGPYSWAAYRVGALAIIIAGTLFFCIPARAADEAAKKDEKAASASADTIKMVEYFVEHEIGDLPPEKIPAFMDVEPSSLPPKLKGKYLVKREDLLTRKKMADTRNKPPIRRLDMGPPDPKDCKVEESKMAWVLEKAGYGKVEEDETRKLSADTKCNECELMIEFSLRKVIDPKFKPKKKDDPPKFIFYLHELDPLWNLVGVYRAGRNNPFGTNFFSMGHASCH